MYLLRMPKADENMGEGTVSRWLVGEGDEVAVREDCCECVADKGEFMVYAEEAGVVRKVFAPEQSVVPVGYVLAAIGDPAGPLPDVLDALDAENAALMARSREELVASPGLGAAPGMSSTVREGERVRATPAARRLARELGVKLARVSASVGSKLVRDEDVRAFASSRSTGAVSRPAETGRETKTGGGADAGARDEPSSSGGTDRPA